MHKEVIVIGGGISGLTAAFRLNVLGVDVLLLEGSGAPGGVIRTEFVNDYLIERGPNSIQGTAEFLDLVDELGIQDQLVEGDPKAPAYVYFNGSLHPVPRGPGALIGTDLLSLSTKLGLLAEPFRQRRQLDEEESVASFFSRRLGAQVAERFAAPFMSGIYAGDAERLSIQAAFPALAQLERDHGSLLRGALHRSGNSDKAPKSSAGGKRRRRRRSCSFRQGMQFLTQALEGCLGEDIRTNCKVTDISIIDEEPSDKQSEARFVLNLATLTGPLRLTCHDLIIATPAFEAARLLAPLSEELSELLKAVEYPPLVIVSVAYDNAQLKAPLDGFGFLAVPTEGLNILGGVYNSSLFPERAPKAKSLVTCFVGGARNPIAARRGDSEISALVHADLSRVLGVSGDPNIVAITRYDRSIPQYNIGHAQRVQRIEALQQKIPGLTIIGNYLHGVSTGDCIKEAEKTARALAARVFA